MEHILLASFVVGLIGILGKQVRYASPKSLEQAMARALLVQEAEKQDKFSESFYTRFNDSGCYEGRTAGRAVKAASLSTQLVSGRPATRADSETGPRAARTTDQPQTIEIRRQMPRSGAMSAGAWDILPKSAL
jgi:hypothetical protein